MRDIKFRAWDAVKKKYISGWEVTGFLSVLNPFDRVNNENIILNNTLGLKMRMAKRYMKEISSNILMESSIYVVIFQEIK